MSEVRFLTAAERELHEAAIYYESCAENLGHRFLRAVEKAIESIAALPFSGTAIENTLCVDGSFNSFPTLFGTESSQQKL